MTTPLYILIMDAVKGLHCSSFVRKNKARIAGVEGRLESLDINYML
jgi:hypothetical protein